MLLPGPAGLLLTPMAPVEQILINAGPSEAGSHRLETFLRCPQFFAYQYDLADEVDLEQTRRGLVRGSLMHVFMAHHYARKGAKQPKGLMHDGECVKDPERFYRPKDAMRLAASKMSRSGDRTIAEKLLPEIDEAMVAYLAWAASRDSTLEVVAVEQQVKTIVANTWKYTARLDLVVRNPRTDAYYVWDHKGTAQTPHTAVWDYLMSLQVAGIRRFALATYGEKFRGIALNFVGWTKPYKFDRLDANRAPALASRMEQIIADTETSIASLRNSKRSPWEWPVNPTNCTDRFGGRCEAWDLCAFGRPRM